jgi:hypothetical protein
MFDLLTACRQRTFGLRIAIVIEKKPSKDGKNLYLQSTFHERVLHNTRLEPRQHADKLRYGSYK